MSRVTYKNYWPGFSANEHLFHHILSLTGKRLTVLGPFDSGNKLERALFKLKYSIAKADYFITGENVKPRFKVARKQVGFWNSYLNHENVLRFPYWMWHLDWPDVSPMLRYPRYGCLMSIDRLMLPIAETYNKHQRRSRLNKAIFFSSHLRDHRRKLYDLTNTTIGCDGIGTIFANGDMNLPKMPVMETYAYSLCPENSVGDGYITEKVPEAFHSGCIPITWCRPCDLLLDFNPDAVVNLYGLDENQATDVLEELASCGSLYEKLISTPLLNKLPSLEPLLEFVAM